MTSGSKGEGLNLNGSDTDFMFFDRCGQVYESEAEVVIEGTRLPFIMNTEDTPPCFTQLYLLTHHQNQTLVRVSVSLMNMLDKNHLGYAFSSELFRLTQLSHVSSVALSSKIHGPCISDEYDQHDFAYCLKCDTWISQAKPWTRRPRTAWPSPELISKIISCGVLFVPIGCKGSINENLEWRISFSVGEKFLTFSFSHTQLLCYAMLKLLLKEIIEKYGDLKGLLCSYFLKTLMFWILEETEPYSWRPNNLIPCFMACLQRLLYCVEYSILSHYFIPDNNLFLLRFNTSNKEALTTLLKNVYGHGIHCFSFSETLQDYQSQCYNITESFISENNRFLQHFMPSYCTILNYGRVESLSRLLYNFLHHSRTRVLKRLFAIQISAAFKFTPVSSMYQTSSNKQHYLIYKHHLSHLMIGLQSDAISGLLMLASFFYVAKHYFASLTILRHTLGKYTDETIYLRIFKNIAIYDMQHHVVNLTMKDTFHTILKLLTTRSFQVDHKSAIVPQELQQDVSSNCTVFHPLPFAHFLHFLCCYHLHDIMSSRESLKQLEQVNRTILESCSFVSHPVSLNTVIMCGIAHQLLDEIHTARRAFQGTATLDKDNLTSAASRLYNLFQ
ncbi:Hypothetical predicted protein [Mytilus galloprovincialis]|uniref:Mab-21-like HhH/H2TH-like domain-containing protein n=1 Tax=Mytilus galloprovincialis TaxID=29158 RepID=A0A8B6DBC5_MYTGA|nr:Hypothetical predicted protein [Mytilus galloprovincialis]VDI18889.1 Hypothetical predicted protein [Mytilus galloprovincialis]